MIVAAARRAVAQGEVLVPGADALRSLSLDLDAPPADVAPVLNACWRVGRVALTGPPHRGGAWSRPVLVARGRPIRPLDPATAETTSLYPIVLLSALRPGDRPILVSATSTPPPHRPHPGFTPRVCSGGRVGQDELNWPTSKGGGVWT